MYNAIAVKIYNATSIHIVLCALKKKRSHTYMHFEKHSRLVAAVNSEVGVLAPAVIFFAVIFFAKK
jgi:hypothetical protein